MEHNLHTRFYGAAVPKGVYGKLHVSASYNEVIGECLEVHVLDEKGEKSLMVYGVNDGHRGYGWIHYNEKIEKDLIKIVEEYEEIKRQKLRKQKTLEKERAAAHKKKVEEILKNY
jgi:hypothetical protein